MAHLDLNGAWTLYYAPETAGKEDPFSPALLQGMKNIPAQVPGNVQLDLYRAGLTPDPFYADGLHAYAPYEYYQWIYERRFDAPSIDADERLLLRFDGIDTIADIYLNDVHLGRTENMFIEHEFDITEAVISGGENRLAVHLHSVMNVARSKGYDIGMRGTAHRNEICHLRKAPHCFGWDIAPRMVTAGLWRSVQLRTVRPTRLTETYYACSALDRSGITLQYGCRFVTDHDTLDGFSIRVTGVCGAHRFTFCEPAHFVSMNYTACIPAPQLWWPAGYGEQPLYDVCMELLYHGNPVDAKHERIGLRTVRLERSFAPDAQAFRFYVNEKPFFAKGTNWVPLDAFHSRDADRLQQAHDLLRDCGCNMVRCWGGNVYEDHAFFDLCDERGILVWQDFAMGNTNYPQTADFDAVMEQEAAAVVRKLRNHACIALWCTDNEIDYKNEGFGFPGRASCYNRVAYETLPRLIQAHDPYRVLLRSSPEIPEGFTMHTVPEQHIWGHRAWYKDDFYLHNTAKFISEFGFHGCPAFSGIRRYIPADALWPLDNDFWAIHSTEDVRIERSNGRNEMMRNHLRIQYGNVPEDPDTFALLSQLYQGEALKTMLELCRSRSDCGGLLWWNLLDCWPQISDAVVDYYFNRKVAYHYLRRCQQPILAFLTDLKGWEHPVFVSNHTHAPVTVTLHISDGDTGELLLEGSYALDADETCRVAGIPGFVSSQRLLVIRYEANGTAYANHFITGLPAYKPEDMLRWFEVIRRLPQPFVFEA